MEIKADIINEQKELNEEQKERFAKRIAENFAKWDEDRAKQITTAKNIMEEVYLDQKSRKTDDKDWKSNIHLNKLHNCNVKRLL